MDTLMIRAATTNDLSALTRLWQEKQALLQQADARFAALISAAPRWDDRIAGWLQDPRCKIFLAENEKNALGFVIGWLRDDLPIHTAIPVGIVSEMVIDIHTYQAGLGRALLTALRAWFKLQNVTQVLVFAPQRYAVEQAFWRALGAVSVVDLMWIK